MNSNKKFRTKNKRAAVRAPRRTPVEALNPRQQIVGAPLVGLVRDYDARARALSLRLEEPLSVGDSVRVKGKDTDLTQRVERLSVGRRSVQSALAGETAAFEIADRVRVGDAVYKVRRS